MGSRTRPPIPTVPLADVRREGAVLLAARYVREGDCLILSEMRVVWRGKAMRCYSIGLQAAEIHKLPWCERWKEHFLLAAQRDGFEFTGDLDVLTVAE